MEELTDCFDFQFIDDNFQMDYLKSKNIIYIIFIFDSYIFLCQLITMFYRDIYMWIFLVFIWNFL